MRIAAFLMLSSLWAVEAGVVRGVVVEYATGLPLARTVVRLIPVPRSGGGEVHTFQTRSGRSGEFGFPEVPDGLYLLVATRDGFFEAGHGQRRPGGHGVPVAVKGDSDLFSDLRMRRKGAITGRVLDENGVGLPGVPVIAYRARLPLRSAGRAQADDRGVYRIHGLDPGKYWIRTAAYTLEDGSGRLPTYGPESRDTIQARVHQVRLDTDTQDADVRPEAGRLFQLRGQISCSQPPGTEVVVTLSSETGRRQARAACPLSGYRFEGLAPGLYEIFAETANQAESGFVELTLDRDSERGSLQLAAAPDVAFEVRMGGATPRTDIPVVLTGRRLEISEVEAERTIAMPRTRLSAGYWEMQARAGAGQFVESIGAARFGPRRPRRPEGSAEWHEVLIETRLPQWVAIVVSGAAGQIMGQVVQGGKSVPGAPVFLWPVTEASWRSLRGSMQKLSNTEGGFRFENLPPGDYRMVASFDVSEVDAEVMEESRAVTVNVGSGRTSAADLALWVAP